MNIPAPKIGPFAINLNTIVVLLGFASGFVTWGYTFAEMRTNQTGNSDNIAKLETRVAANEATLRRLDNHELRITDMEKAATDAAETMKSLDRTINDLSGDMRVVKEILMRIEATQNRLDDGHVK